LKGIPLGDEHNGALAERLASVVRDLYGVCDKVGVPYGTDASKIAVAGIPAVVFGPGSIDQAHTADEWLSLDELTKASEAIYQFVRRG
jgi:acetylornithine deacetylase